MEIVLLQLQEDPPPPQNTASFAERVCTRREGCGRARRMGCVGRREDEEEDEEEEEEEEEKVHLSGEIRKWTLGVHYVQRVESWHPNKF